MFHVVNETQSSLLHKGQGVCVGSVWTGKRMQLLEFLNVYHQSIFVNKIGQYDVDLVVFYFIREDNNKEKGISLKPPPLVRSSRFLNLFFSFTEFLNKV